MPEPTDDLTRNKLEGSSLYGVKIILEKTPKQLEEAVERVITAREEWAVAIGTLAVAQYRQELDEQWTELTKRQRLGILPLLLDEEEKRNDNA